MGLPIETPASLQEGRVVVRREEIIAAHNLGNPVLLNVEGGGHWVVSKGALGCDNKGETLFDIVDPGDSSGAHDGPRTLSQLRCKKAIILKRRDQGFPASQAILLGLRNLPAPSEIPLYVQTIGAINVLLSTSKGPRAGFDPASGQTFSEIPGAVLLPEFPIGTPEAPYTDEESKSLEEVCGRLIALSGGPGESFTVKLTAKTPTEYAVYLGGGNFDQRIPAQVVSGNLAAGESTTIPVAVKSELPTLQITRGGDKGLILSWPTSFSGFKVQAATNASVPFVWFDLKDSPSTVADRFVLSQPVSGSITLFRLIRQ